MKRILIISTLDTKKDETMLLKRYIEEHGCDAVILDCSLRRNSIDCCSDLRLEMMTEEGVDEDALEKMSKDEALRTMQAIARAKTLRLYAGGKIDGAIGIGGIQGTLLSSAAMKDLPIGVPKLIFSTVANGKATFGPLVGTSDMTIMHSVIDIAGNNHLIKMLLGNAAAAICGMVKNHNIVISKRQAVGITMGGVTTPCILRIKNQLEEKGFEVIIFHCNGIGAMSMERLLENGKLSAIMDITPHDVMDLLYDGLMPAAKERYEIISKSGVPTIIAPGCADIILFDGLDNVPEKYKNRKYVKHNDIHIHVKADYNEMYKLGSFIADRFRNTSSNVSVLIPNKGFGQYNFPGGPLYEPESDQGLVDALKQVGNERLEIKCVDFHINDYEFADLCVQELISKISGTDNL